VALQVTERQLHLFVGGAAKIRLGGALKLELRWFDLSALPRARPRTRRADFPHLTTWNVNGGGREKPQ
jgi:hypothetical protein